MLDTAVIEYIAVQGAIVFHDGTSISLDTLE